MEPILPQSSPQILSQRLEPSYAGFWVRVLSSIIDGLILVIPTWFASAGAPVIGGLVIYYLYKVIFEISPLQATPGKALLDLKVTTENGERISFKAGNIRWLLSYVSGCLLGVGYLMAAFTKKKQTLHDMVAKTVVVRASSPDVNYFKVWLDQVKATFKGLSDSNTSLFKSDSTEAVQKKLEQLNQLYRENLITDEEYRAKKEEILRQF